MRVNKVKIGVLGVLALLFALLHILLINPLYAGGSWDGAACSDEYNGEGQHSACIFSFSSQQLRSCTWQETASQGTSCYHCGWGGNSYNKCVIEKWTPATGSHVWFKDPNTEEIKPLMRYQEWEEDGEMQRGRRQVQYDQYSYYGCANTICTCTAECQCTPRNCPPPIAATKFTQTPANVNGSSLSCADKCNPTTASCAPSYFNSAPSCSILPQKIVMKRSDEPKKFNITVSDRDYGDSIEIVSVKSSDTAGNLNACAKITNEFGGSLLGTIKSGSDSSTDITKTTPFLVDARESHGNYLNVGNRSVCSANLEIGITDVDSDGPGGVDNTAGVVTCNVAIEIENDPPQVSNIKLFDNDADSSLREAGDLINGSKSTVAVGSSNTVNSSSRASFCKESLTLIEPIKCPEGGESYIASRHNPLLFEFTVSDENGANDIMQAGVWIQLQEVGASTDSVVVPPVRPNPNPNLRTSFQAVYSEKESKDIGGKYYFISRGCLTSACGPLSLASSSKQIFSGLAFISPNLGAFAGENLKVGNLLRGLQQQAPTSSWHQKGFPDCLLTGTCSSANVPVNASLPPTTDVSQYANYDWAIGADENTLLCFPSDNNAPRAVQHSTPIVCPSNCAACIKRGNVVAENNGKEMTFQFHLYMNDRSLGQGMLDGKYAVFVSALDKMGVPINHVTGKGAEGWVRFDKNGAPCTSSTCMANAMFALQFDSTPPVVEVSKFVTRTTTSLSITAALNDGNGTGIAGVSNRFMALQETLGGEPTGDARWATKLDGAPFDGSSDKLATTSETQTLVGKNLEPELDVTAGLCAYDHAGNMGCGRNNNAYVFLSPWLKTSLGDVYSNIGGTGSPFDLSLPSNDGSTNDATATRNLYNPYTEQVFTIGSGVIMTAGSSGQGIGILGGFVQGTNNSQLGFAMNGTSYYRNGSSSSPFNVYSHTPLTVGNEFKRLKAVASYNCDLINERTPNTCQTSGSLETINQAEQNILLVGDATISTPLECSKPNVIFVTGNVTVESSVLKSSATGGCIFVLDRNASLVIKDIPSNQRTSTADGKGLPYIDHFQAAVIGDQGATFSVTKPVDKSTNKSIDRLEIKGWVYTNNTVPVFLRTLAPVDNRRLPAEWIIYDASLLDAFRHVLGSEKTVDLVCGTSTHVLCQTVK